MGSLEGKVALVTGASGGIGLAAARKLSQEGARVALVARSEDKLRALETELPDSFAIIADLSQPSAPAEVMDAVLKHYGRLDILINNAGQGLGGPLEHFSIDGFRAILELNVVSIVALTQKAIPHLRAAGGGSIINISSGLTKTIVPGVSAYAATKYALDCLSLTSRIELAKDNIRVSLVHPWVTETDFFSNVVGGEAGRKADPSMDPDTPEYVADLVFEAIQTGAPEVVAAKVLADVNR